MNGGAALKLAMIGVDFHTAKIEMREKISLTENSIKEILKKKNGNKFVDGIVTISTCNRTEIYISSGKYIDNEELIRIFSNSTQILEDGLDKYCYIKREDEMIYYLFELACGLHSMILGEDQIITQVNEAIEMSMKEKSSNSILNTLFRYAVTCAKKAKSQVNINHISPSIVSSAIDLAEQYIKLNNDIRVLVIGNGEIGRLAATSFIEKGCDVTMTKRNYKYSNVIVPDGCKTISYKERFQMFSEVDIVVSATKSPHFTITYHMIQECNHRPDYIFDLAMPRDIDPKIKNVEEIMCFDVDDIGNSTSYYEMDKIKEIKEIIKKYHKKFHKWYLVYNNLQMGAKVK